MSHPHQLGGSTPHEEYTRRLEARQMRVRQLLLHHRLIARLRNAVFGAIVLQVLLTEKERGIVFCTLLVLPAVLFTSLVLLRNHLQRAIRRALVAVDYYERRLRCLTDSWAGQGEPGTRYRDEAHPCAPDLDLFGSGGLFELLCTPCTRWGQDTLAAWLCRAATVDEIRARQGAVAELRAQLDMREELAVRAREVPSPEGLRVWLAEPETVSTATRWLAVMLSLLCLTTFLGWAGGVLGPLPFLAVLLLERGHTRTIHRRFPTLRAILWQPRRGLAALAALLQRVERIQGASERSSRSLAQLGSLLALAPLAALLFCGTPLALAVASWRGRRQSPGHAC